MPTGFVRAPRVQIQTDNGTFTPLEADIYISMANMGDEFKARLAMDDPIRGDTSPYWANTVPIKVTVSGANDVGSGSYTTLFVGEIKQVSLEMDRRIVEITGHDPTGDMIHSKTDEKWQNKQPQDIIQDLAGRVGLSAQFSGKAVDRAGLKYNQDYNRISELDTYWNVITRLARDLGCVAFVKGTTVYVQPWNQPQAGDTVNIHYSPPTASAPAQGNFLRMRCLRNMDIAGDLKVSHFTWQHKAGQSSTSKYKSTGQGGKELNYTFKDPNMTKQQQDALTESRLDEIAGHERVIEILTYGDVAVQPTMQLRVSGTNTAFDQTYFIITVAHHFSFNDGYQMDITARNRDSERGANEQEN